MKKLIILITLLFLSACASVSTGTKTEPPKARYIFSDKNGLYGLLDENGNEIVPAQYLYVDIVKNGMIPAFTTEKEFVFLDETGRKIKDISFYNINSSYSEGLLAVADSESRKWGFVDKDLNYVIRPQFEDVWGFIDGIALAKQNEVWGIIDKAGKYVIDPQFDDPKLPIYYDYYQGTFAVLKADKTRIVDVKKAKILETEYDGFYGMTGNKAVVEKDSSIYLNSWENNEIFLMKKPSGSLHHIYYRNTLGNNRFYLEYSEKREQKYYQHFVVFDSSNGEKICEKILGEERAEDLDESCNLKEKKYNYPSILNNDKYEEVWRDRCAEESSILFKQNGKKGFLDENGKEIIPAEYDQVKAFCQGVSWVRKGDRRFIIDRSGKTVFEINPEWRYVKEVNFVDREFYEWGLMSFTKTNKWYSRDMVENFLRYLIDNPLN